MIYNSKLGLCSKEQRQRAWNESPRGWRGLGRICFNSEIQWKWKPQRTGRVIYGSLFL